MKKKMKKEVEIAQGIRKEGNKWRRNMKWR